MDIGLQGICFLEEFGARGRNRTGTTVKSRDFKSVYNFHYMAETRILKPFMHDSICH